MATGVGGPLNNIPNPGIPAGSNTTGGYGGIGTAGSIFTQLNKAPNAQITPAKVALPSSGDFGDPATAPTINDPNKGDYGLDPTDKAAAQAGITTAAGVANKAQFGFNNPTKTGAFANLMNLANEQTGAAQQAAQMQAKDAAQKRGYAGGFEDTSRSSSIDRMNALATAGFQGADQIQQEEGAQYGRAIGAFTALQDSYNQAEAAGNTAFAHDLTTTHIQNASNQLAALDLNAQEKEHYGDALNQAKQLQANLNEQFNKDKIDNSRFIQGNAQIAAQLQATMATLGEKAREFNISSTQQSQELGEKTREFNAGQAADPRTALRAVPGGTFGGMLA